MFSNFPSSSAIVDSFLLGYTKSLQCVLIIFNSHIYNIAFDSSINYISPEIIIIQILVDFAI